MLLDLFKLRLGVQDNCRWSNFRMKTMNEQDHATADRRRVMVLSHLASLWKVDTELRQAHLRITSKCPRVRCFMQANVVRHRSQM